MKDWQILGITPTTDIKSIKKAYIRLIKRYHPEDHPERFQQIRKAYESALQWAAEGEKADPGGASRMSEAPPGSAQAPLFEATRREHGPLEVLDVFQHAPENIATLVETSDVGIDPSLVDFSTADSRDHRRPDGLDRIERKLAANRQEEAVEIFRRQLAEMNCLADRLTFGKRLYRLLSDLPRVPMVFTEYVVHQLNWDTPSARSDATPDGTSTDVMAVYRSVRNLKRTLADTAPSRLQTLRRKPSRIFITLQAFRADRREYILRWIDAVSPYEDYYDYLGLHPGAVAAWRDELRHPQYPPDSKDYVTALFLGAGYGYYGARLFAWPLWAKVGAGVGFALTAALLLVHLPIFRWAGFKWREHWRPNAPGNLTKSLLDIIPLGIMAFFSAVGHFVFPGMDNPATYALFIFLISLLGLRGFLVLAAVTVLFTVMYSTYVPDPDVALIWFIVFGAWLKIKLTLTDNSTVGGKKAGRLGYAMIAAGCWAVVYFKWRLPF